MLEDSDLTGGETDCPAPARKVAMREHQIAMLKELEPHVPSTLLCDDPTFQYYARRAVDHAAEESRKAYSETFGRLSGGKALGVLPRKGKASVVDAILAKHRENFAQTKRLFDSVVWDDLPHIPREETPYCQSVHVWDANGFEPAVRLCDRHPVMLVADDWRKATTFDLFSMAIKVHNDYYRTWTLDDIIDIKRWVDHLDTVQVIKFDDITAPAVVYYNAMNGHRLSRFNGGIGLDYLRLTVIRYLYPKPRGNHGKTNQVLRPVDA